MSPGRFGPTQCGQWLCLLAISVTCCVFITQPLMVSSPLRGSRVHHRAGRGWCLHVGTCPCRVSAW